MPKTNKRKPPRTQGQILADVAAGNLDRAVDEAKATMVALDGLTPTSVAATVATTELMLAIRHLKTATDHARRAFENDWR